MNTKTITTIALLSALTGCRGCFPFESPADGGELDAGTTEPTDAGVLEPEPTEDAGTIVVEPGTIEFLDAGDSIELPPTEK